MPSSKSEQGYHLEATGEALKTVESHQSPQDLTLFGSCFCPFVQRAWVSILYSDIAYQYYEVDPYKKPRDLLEVSPRGLVPGLKLNNSHPPKAVAESSVIMEYIDELAASQGKPTLLPVDDLYARSVARFQADHVNRNLIPAFYRYLQAQEIDAQIEGAKDFIKAIEQLVDMFEKADKDGVKLGLYSSDKLGWVDCMAVPWLFRATNVLTHYRGFQLPESTKFKAYLDKLLSHPIVKATCSTDELYLDSYARYAENRPHTSQVADATNKGRGLP